MCHSNQILRIKVATALRFGLSASDLMGNARLGRWAGPRETGWPRQIAIALSYEALSPHVQTQDLARRFGVHRSYVAHCRKRVLERFNNADVMAIRAALYPPPPPPQFHPESAMPGYFYNPGVTG